MIYPHCSAIDCLSQMMTSLKITSHDDGIPYSIIVLVFKESAYNLSPHEFWNMVSGLFFSEKQITHIVLQNTTFNRKTIENILSFPPSIPLQQLPSYVQKLKQTEIELVQRNELGFTPFHLAAITARVDLIQTKETNDVDKPDKRGRTPLQLAAFFGNCNMITELINRGANHALCTPIYGSALSQAMLGKDKETIIFLKQLAQLHHEKRKKEPFFKTATNLFKHKWVPTDQSEENFTKEIEESKDPALLREYYEEETARRAFYHSWKIDWGLVFGPNDKIKHKITFQDNDRHLEFTPKGGGFSCYFQYQMAISIEKFAQLFDNDLVFDRPCLLLLAETLALASNQYKGNLHAILERHAAKKPSIVNAYLPKHVVNIVIQEDIIVLCNNGKGRRKTVEVRRFNKALLTEHLLELMNTKFPSIEAYNQFFFEELPKLLGFFPQSPCEKALEELLSRAPQIIGNCSWEGPEISSHVVCVLHKLLQRGLINSELFTKQRARIFIEETDYLSHNVLLFLQLDTLETYLERTAKTDRKFISNNEMYAPIVKPFHEKMASKSSHPYLVKRMETMLTTYPLLRTFKNYT